MKNITDKKYEEYLALKRWAKRENVYQSACAIIRLEDDIDLPVKKCVAMFALLGFQPLFSCCGFDYHGQPIHKSHQYGRPYFMFQGNPKSLSLVGCRFSMGWRSVSMYNKTTVFLENVIEGNPHWRKKDCIHFSEECNIAISWIEKWLLSNKSLMADTITLEDTNQNYKKNSIRFWQYPAKEPWIIQKELLDTY